MNGGEFNFKKNYIDLRREKIESMNKINIQMCINVLYAMNCVFRVIVFIVGVRRPWLCFESRAYFFVK